MTDRKPIGCGIFVKTIGISNPKSRLAAGIGRAKADEFYRLSCHLIQTKMAVAQSQGLVEPYWALAESLDEAEKLWTGFNCLSQGQGDLGDRLFTIFDRLLEQHGRASVMGADAPHIPENLFKQVQAYLDEGFDFVLGPARDGGFYLLAGQQRISAEDFNKVNYSSESTLSELEARLLKAGAKIKRLAMLSDADHPEDLPVLKQEMLLQNSQADEHLQMLAWLDQTLEDSKISISDH